MTLGQKIIVTVGSYIITFITICMIFKYDISFMLTSRNIDRKYGNMTENSYFVEDHFKFVDNYDKAELHSKEDIINSIYYLINTGSTYAKRYCAKDYFDCYKDMEALTNDANLLSILNNYVHPYNSFETLMFNFDDRVVDIEIKHSYSKENIKAINEKVDEVINSMDLNSKSTRDKIKIIHDYIINNTEYDSLKTNNIKDNTYKSNTAYGVMIEGKGICSGYSDTMKIFLDKLNIVNYKVSNDEHIWNVVMLDEGWLHLDLTWDDPISEKNITRDNYFLIDNATLKLLDDDEHHYNKDYFPEVK